MYLPAVLVLSLAIGVSQSLAPAGRAGLQDAHDSSAAAVAEPDHGPLDRLLASSVHDGRVDYLSIRDHHAPELVAYLDALAAVEPSRLAPKAGLAFCINLYNATVIRAVTERLVAGYSPSRDSWSLFDEPLVRVSGRRISLNRLEHEIIRPRYQDPRVHAALVCAAVSCPPLLPRAYRAEDLDRILDENLRRFLGDPDRNPIDRKARRLRLSKIFEWYAEDFGGPEGVRELVARHLGFDPKGAPLEFVDYSWALNIEPPRSGRWVRVTEAGAAMSPDEPGSGSLPPARPGELVEVLAEAAGRLRVRRPGGRGTAWLAAEKTRPYPDPAGRKSAGDKR